MKSYLLSLRTLFCVLTMAALLCLSCESPQPDQAAKQPDSPLTQTPEAESSETDITSSVDKAVEAEPAAEAEAVEVVVVEAEPEPAAPVEPEPAVEPEAAKPEAPAESAGDAVAVTVNGSEITEKDIDKKMQPQLERMAQQGSKIPPQFLE